MKKQAARRKTVKKVPVVQMSHFEINEEHFRVYGQIMRDRTVLVVPRDLNLNSTSRNRRRNWIMKALSRFIALENVKRLYDDEENKVKRAITTKLKKHENVLVYTLVKRNRSAELKDYEVVVHARIGDMHMMEIDYNFAACGFKCVQKPFDNNTTSEDRVFKYIFEV